MSAYKYVLLGSRICLCRFLADSVGAYGPLLALILASASVAGKGDVFVRLPMVAFGCTSEFLLRIPAALLARFGIGFGLGLTWMFSFATRVYVWSPFLAAGFGSVLYLRAAKLRTHENSTRANISNCNIMQNAWLARIPLPEVH